MKLFFGLTLLVTLIALSLPRTDILAQIPITVVATEGDSHGDGIIEDFRFPFTDGNGRVGFVGNHARDNFAGRPFLWYDQEVIWRSMDETVFYPPLSAPRTMGVSNSGRFIFDTVICCGPLFPNDALWTENGLLLEEGDQAPDYPTGVVITSLRNSTMSPDGTAYWTAGTSTTGVIYKHVPGTSPVGILRSNDMVDGQTIYRIERDYDSSDNNDHLIAVLDMAPGNTNDDFAVYVDGSIVSQEGSSTGSSGEIWLRGFWTVNINDSGDYIFSGLIRDETGISRSALAHNGVVAIRSGDTIDGVNLSSNAQLIGASINNDGFVVHIWSDSGQKAVFYGQAADLANSVTVLQSWDLVEDGNPVATYVNDVEALSFRPSVDLADDGQIFLQVNLDYGFGTPIATSIISVEAPSLKPVINEVRIDQTGTDTDQYFEISGQAGASLSDLYYIVIGDGTSGNGTIESAVNLTGQIVPADGFFLAAEPTFSLGSGVDLTTTLNFDNNDNVTHLLAEGFTGSLGDDLDTDDDGVLDVTPWTSVTNCIALIQTIGAGDATYCTDTVGPNGLNSPAHAYRLPDGLTAWNYGELDPAASRSNDTPGTSNMAPLPVELIGFSAIIIIDNIELKWQTATETNNSGFVIEMSEKNSSGRKPWTELGFVSGQGSTTETHDYSYQITGIDPGIYEFRLKQIDFDGSFEYSSVVLVKIEIPNTIDLKHAYPNPFKTITSFSFILGMRQNVKIEVFDQLGRKVVTLLEEEVPAQIRQEVRFDSKDLTSGIYLIQLTGDQALVAFPVTLIR